MQGKFYCWTSEVIENVGCFLFMNGLALGRLVRFFSGFENLTITLHATDETWECCACLRNYVDQQHNGQNFNFCLERIFKIIPVVSLFSCNTFLFFVCLDYWRSGHCNCHANYVGLKFKSHVLLRSKIHLLFANKILKIVCNLIFFEMILKF